MFRCILILLATLSCTGIATAGILERTATVAFQDLRLSPSADLWEYSGFIVRRNGGGYYYTMFPHTDKSKDSVSFDIKSHMQVGDVLIAIYHNHPCHALTHYTSFFSLVDLNSARGHAVPTFMLDNCTGDVHEFDWKLDTIRGTGRHKRVRLPDGKDRLDFLPTGRLIGNIGYSSPNLDTEWVQLQVMRIALDSNH